MELKKKNQLSYPHQFCTELHTAVTKQNEKGKERKVKKQKQHSTKRPAERKKEHSNLDKDS